MNIEFIGLPGSGKSYIALELSKLLNAKGYKTGLPNLKIVDSGTNIRKFKKVFMIFLFLFQHPIKFFTAVSLIIVSKQNNMHNFIKVMYNFLYINALINKSTHEDEITIFDEGFLQGLW